MMVVVMSLELFPRHSCLQSNHHTSTILIIIIMFTASKLAFTSLTSPHPCTAPTPTTSFIPSPSSVSRAQFTHFNGRHLCLRRSLFLLSPKATADQQGKVGEFEGDAVVDSNVLPYCSIDKKEKKSVGELEQEFLQALQLSWSKKMVRKFLNIKGYKCEDSHADAVAYGGGGVECGSRSSFSEREPCTIKKSKTEKFSRSASQVRRARMNLDHPRIIDVQNYSVFVATWNVAGRSPPSNLTLDDWLHSSPPADIYVLGFQEIVPLNAGNILVSEDNGPAKKWLALIRKTLNNLPGTSGSSGCYTPSPILQPVVELNADFEGSARQKNSSFFHRRSFQTTSSGWGMDNDPSGSQPQLDRRYSVCDRVISGHSHRPSDFDPSLRWGYRSSDYSRASDYSRPSDYSRWGSSDDDNGLVDSPSTVSFSPMSYGGSAANEDGYGMPAGHSSHLTSGQKEGDELRRNSDVMEILKKTRFPRVHGVDNEKSPQTILEHDRIIWLGDLNYRIALSYRSAKALVEMQNWRALLENDQLRIEQKRGRAFVGWKEGKIYFPPTYKYSTNSDRYAGDDMHPKEKRRTPAWCDRILWYGEGLHQLSYVRGESRFSDHRPVYGIFWAEVESTHGKLKKSMSCSRSRIEVEELLPYSGGYTELNFF